MFFNGKCPAKELELSLELFGEVEVSQSRWNSKGRNIILLIEKKEKKFWSRIKKDDKKEATIQIDWQKWVDEDDETEKPLGNEWDEGGMKKFDEKPEFKESSSY